MIKEVVQDIKSYVCFTPETGEIFSVGPSKNEDYSILEVNYSDVEKILTMKENMSEYEVVFVVAEEKFQLKKKNSLVHSNFYNKLSEEDQELYPMITVKVFPNGCNVVLKQEVKDHFLKLNVDTRKTVSFNFTKKDDPHVLLGGFVLDDITNDSFVEFKRPTEKFSIFCTSDLRGIYQVKK